MWLINSNKMNKLNYPNCWCLKVMKIDSMLFNASKLALLAFLPPPLFFQVSLLYASVIFGQFWVFRMFSDQIHFVGLICRSGAAARWIFFFLVRALGAAALVRLGRAPRCPRAPFFCSLFSVAVLARWHRGAVVARPFCIVLTPFCSISVPVTSCPQHNTI